MWEEMTTGQNGGRFGAAAAAQTGVVEAAEGAGRFLNVGQRCFIATRGVERRTRTKLFLFTFFFFLL